MVRTRQSPLKGRRSDNRSRYVGDGGSRAGISLQCGASREASVSRPERCRSGRTGLTRNQLNARAFRGFESLPLRQ